jgi:hypothetical protein
MKKILNTEQNNEYYKLINGYVEDYISNHKISPRNLRNYFMNNEKLNSFLKRYKLDDVDGIKRVFRDVIDDWHSIEADAVMTFEKFQKMNEDNGSINIQEANMEYEKVLADLYHTSVGHVNEIDSKEHTYTVKDFGKEIDVVIYSNDDIESFKKDIMPILINKTKSEDVDLLKIDVGLRSRNPIQSNITFKVEEILDEEKLEKKLSDVLSNGKILKIMDSFINNKEEILFNSTEKKWIYKQEYRGFHIWELNKMEIVY